MRRRDMISRIAALLALPAVAEENMRLPPELPDGTRQIARFVDLPNKRRLLQLADRPPNYETPVEAFTDTVTPNDRFFVRYYLAGVPSAADVDGWTLNITGDAIDRPVRLTMTELVGLPSNQVPAVCQCAGNRRGLSLPHVPGVQWGDGAMGAAVWRGPALRDALACPLNPRQPRAAQTATGWRRYASPRDIMAQMIWAILLARATAASLRGLRCNCRSHPEADLLPGWAKRMTDMAPTNSNCRNLSLPALLILPIRCLPPVECSFGVRPS